MPFFKRFKRSERAEQELASLPAFFAIRSSVWFIASTVGLAVFTDLACYGLMIPYIPFRLEALGYSDTSSLAGWLVAAYAGGLIVSSPPIGWIGEYGGARRLQLLIYLSILAGGTVLFMLSTNFSIMVVARILQGIAGTGTWTLGLSLISDTVPEHRISEIMGYVMVGWSAGGTVGYPLGGILYQKLGFRAPSVFALICIFLDFVLRLLIIEKRPAAKLLKRHQKYLDRVAEEGSKGKEVEHSEKEKEEDDLEKEKSGIEDLENEINSPEKDKTEADVGDEKAEPAIGERGKDDLAIEETPGSNATDAPKSTPTPKSIANSLKPSSASTRRKMSPVKAFIYLCSSPRAMSLFFMSFCLGFVYSALLDTGIPIHLDKKYGMTPLVAGVVILAATTPNFVVGPIGGALADRYGARLIICIGTTLSLPWYGVLAVPSNSLAAFIVLLVFAFTFQNCSMAPVVGDMSKVVLTAPPEAGLGYSHLYGLFNFCFSTGLFVGPIAAGQALEHLGGRTGGWNFIVIITVCLLAIQVPFAWFFVGREGTRTARRRQGEVEAERTAEEGAQTEVDPAREGA
ncbi:MFS general substrate transporter [Atractiella rhizophila]|nr:MFS general substrate transporter [Atractiella rhizophila]